MPQQQLWLILDDRLPVGEVRSERGINSLVWNTIIRYTKSTTSLSNQKFLTWRVISIGGRQDFFTEVVRRGRQT